ncbi:cyclic pyranopterin monophosphate synthase MoaC [Pullulanibacillus sp. KACC 23026]|uniref:cyclic pyranopterin monophosphate synthase MoaC n=1 Tax=Pullulanibacillus sp. KACC 23026 TaxID=3028315 RepID=UPI0023AEAD9C|nr:cyclic pyranopterin monophosphate synthase MoaC [Pullulanibacillus sp. KACC 23026]WEG12507.1 cyclic pyranopterin monophosphate synthase MoaC [Pullulanibacillus sp. KACC 23026]
MSDLTHINEQGRAKMVDVSDKEETRRMAVACSSIQVNQEIYEAINQGTIKKGDVLAVAQVAGIMAAKNTSQIIPMCHPLMLSGVDLFFYWDDKEAYLLRIEATVKNKGATGVEMEALTAATTAALTIYDMCKALDKSMVIGPTYLQSKSGGKSGDYQRETN